MTETKIADGYYRLTVDDVDVDGDGQNDRIIIKATQNANGSVSVMTSVDETHDGLTRIDNAIGIITVRPTSPTWRLSDMKFEQNKLILLGKDGSPGADPIPYDDLIQQRFPDDRGIGEKKAAPMGRIGDNPIATRGLSDAEIEAVIKEPKNWDKIKACYQSKLPSDQDFSGTVTIEFFVNPDGNVIQAKLKNQRTTASRVGYELGNQIGAALEHFKFPPGDGIAHGTYQFQFPLD